MKTGSTAWKSRPEAEHSQGAKHPVIANQFLLEPQAIAQVMVEQVLIESLFRRGQVRQFAPGR